MTALSTISGVVLIFDSETSGSDKLTGIIPVIIMIVAFYFLFRRGNKILIKSLELVKEGETVSDRIKNFELPTEQYGDGKVLHTNFIIEIPFLAQVVIDGTLLKIQIDRMSQHNKETVINLKDVSNIKFEDVTLTPGYIAFETPSHSISKADFKTDSNTIPFAGAEVKEYILELKAYTEYLMNNK